MYGQFTMHGQKNIKFPQFCQLRRLYKMQKTTLMNLNQKMEISKQNSPLITCTAQVLEQ